jgi:hypothetical protein
VASCLDRIERYRAEINDSNGSEDSGSMQGSMVYKGTVEEFDSGTMIEHGTMVEVQPEKEVNTMICKYEENSGTVRIDYEEKE